jgi:hypothetical protein
VDAAIGAMLDDKQRGRLIRWQSRLLVTAEHPDIPEAPYAALNLDMRRSANTADSEARLGPWTPNAVLEEVSARRGNAGKHAREVLEVRMHHLLDGIMLAEREEWNGGAAAAERYLASLYGAAGPAGAGARAGEYVSESDAIAAAAASVAAQATAARLATMMPPTRALARPQPSYAIHGDAYSGPTPYASAAPGPAT